MKNGLRWLGGLILIIIVAVAGMAALNICPPEGPWPQPPWCPGSLIDWPFSQPEAVTEQRPTPRPEIVIPESREESLVSMVEAVFRGLTSVQTYFDQSLVSMVRFTPENYAALIEPESSRSGRLACTRPYQGTGPYNIPEEFIGPLADDGFIAAPEGACGAGAMPEVRFLDMEGEAVTGERMEEEEIQTLAFEALTGGNQELRSLESIIMDALQPGDMRLTSPEGWDEVLWEVLRAEQQPMDSLIEYQLWNTAEAIETLVVDSIEARMQTMGIPPIVIEAFRQSDLQGWFASQAAQPENALSSMEIVAEFEGGFTGTIEEQRSFTLTEPGEMPEFGPLRGSGEVAFDHPDLGMLNFDVALEWDEWDELGRVSGGEMSLIEPSEGYEIRLTFAPDGSSEGEVLVEGEMVGRVEVTVDEAGTYLEFIPLE